MGAISYSGCADHDDMLGAPIQFWQLGGQLYHRNPDSGRVFRIVINRAGLASSLENVDDEEHGEVVREPGMAIDEDRLAAIGRDVAGASRFEEVPPGVLSGVNADPVPLTERQLDPVIADDVLEIADEIDVHCAEIPLARPVPANIEPVIPLADELVLAVLVARPNVTAAQLSTWLERRGCKASTTNVGSALAKLKVQGKAASSRHGGRTSTLQWKATDRGVAEVEGKIRPALLALADAT